MEKADILEMAVNHLRQLQRQHFFGGSEQEPTSNDNFRLGFHECAQEVSRYLQSLPDEEVELRARILDHLSQVVMGIASIRRPVSNRSVLPSMLMGNPSLSTANRKTVTGNGNVDAMFPMTSVNLGVSPFSATNATFNLNSAGSVDFIGASMSDNSMPPPPPLATVLVPSLTTEINNNSTTLHNINCAAESIANKSVVSVMGLPISHCLPIHSHESMVDVIGQINMVSPSNCMSVTKTNVALVLPANLVTGNGQWHSYVIYATSATVASRESSFSPNTNDLCSATIQGAPLSFQIQSGLQAVKQPHHLVVNTAVVSSIAMDNVAQSSPPSSHVIGQFAEHRFDNSLHLPQLNTVPSVLSGSNLGSGFPILTSIMTSATASITSSLTFGSLLHCSSTPLDAIKSDAREIGVATPSPNMSFRADMPKKMSFDSVMAISVENRANTTDDHFHPSLFQSTHHPVIYASANTDYIVSGRANNIDSQRDVVGGLDMRVVTQAPSTPCQHISVQFYNNNCYSNGEPWRPW